MVEINDILSAYKLVELNGSGKNRNLLLFAVFFLLFFFFFLPGTRGKESNGRSHTYTIIGVHESTCVFILGEIKLRSSLQLHYHLSTRYLGNRFLSNLRCNKCGILLLRHMAVTWHGPSMREMKTTRSPPLMTQR